MKANLLHTLRFWQRWMTPKKGSKSIQEMELYPRFIVFEKPYENDEGHLEYSVDVFMADGRLLVGYSYFSRQDLMALKRIVDGMDPATDYYEAIDELNDHFFGHNYEEEMLEEELSV